MHGLMLLSVAGGPCFRTLLLCCVGGSTRREARQIAPRRAGGVGMQQRQVDSAEGRRKHDV